MQRALNKLKESDTSEKTKEYDNDWDDKPKATQGSSKNAADNVAGLDNDYQVTSLSWNSNGSTIAVAFGKTNHATWCDHHSNVSLWSVFRRDFDAKKPTNTIEVSNCVTQVAFHPSDPLILAGGTLNGEIYLWNIDLEEPQLCVSAIDEYYHREAITKLIWVKNESLNLEVKISLVSTSTDGKILVWRAQDKLRYPIKGHLLARKKGNETQIIGGTSLDRVHF